MKSMQRKFGGYTNAKSADEASVQAVLTDFKHADELLDTFIKHLKAWRDGWDFILKKQYETSDAFATLYRPIMTPDGAEARHIPAETPQAYMQKCLGLQHLYEEAQDDLSKEVGLITEKVLGKAETAKLHAKPLHRTIKHRENMKLDFERYLGKVESARAKSERDPRAETNLARHEADLAQAKINYQTADEHVKENFPGVTDAIYSLIPYLQTSTIMLQTTLVGQLYTLLDAYTRYQKLPNPAPPDAEIIAAWTREFNPLRHELEGELKTIAGGKTVHLAMTVPEKTSSGGLSWMKGRKPAPPPPTAGAIEGRPSRPMIEDRPQRAMIEARSPRPSISSRQSISPRPSMNFEEEEAPVKPPRPGAATLAIREKPQYGNQTYTAPPPPYESRPATLTPGWQTKQSYDHQANGGASPPAQHNGNGSSEYFGSRRTSAASSIASSAAAMGAAKKKPPPPVPVKRIPSSTAQFVTALFDFDAQSAGDLPFREGDRIRVVKKTDSTDDWWTGELRGVTGSFPANYVSL